MGYTYDDFVTAAKNAGMYESFAQEDLTTAEKSPEYGLSLLKLQQDAGKATTEEQKLLVQEAVNQLRNTYGVTLPATNTGTGGSFSYDRETDYKKLLDKISTPGSFEFDHRSDPTYGAIKDSWIADGDRTQSSLLKSPTIPQTGWAQNASQQGNNYYDAQLTDQIPTIYQNAFEEHLNNQNTELSKLGAVTGDKNFDYAAYLQQQQLDQEAAQQKFTNDMTLHKTFGTEAPTMPDLDKLTPGTDTAYSYGKNTEYQKALDGVLSQEKFDYSHTNDPLYASLRKTALREGDREAADILAEINARTGGVASSYGVRAASDAGNQFNQDLNAAVPGLRQTAYQEHLADFDAKLQGLTAMEEDRAFDYQKWLQEYQLKEAAKQQEFENALALYKVAGLTPEIAEILGVPYVVSGGEGGTYRGDKKLTYNQIRNEFFTGLSHGATEGQAAQFLANAVRGGHITQSQAQKIASAYTADERMWDRHG